MPHHDETETPGGADELASLLVAERPALAPAQAARLDARLDARFAAAREARRQSAPRWRRPRRGWVLSAGGAVAAAVAAVAVVVSLPSGGANHLEQTPALGISRTPGPVAAPSSAGSTSSSGTASASSAPLTPPGAQPAAGRSVVQSAQLSLGAPAGHIDDVAAELFRVAGAEGGIVLRSSITQTGGPDGYAQIDLSLPSAALPQAMAQLSRLPYARVLARTDNAQDVTGAVNASIGALTEAQSLRTALLHQLAAATTTNQLASLRAQLRDADAAIARDRAQLQGLRHRVSFSTVAVTITAATGPAPARHHHARFGVGAAWHAAGRVLGLAAGALVLVLALGGPLTALAAAALWLAARLRRRARLEALRQV